MVKRFNANAFYSWKTLFYSFVLIALMSTSAQAIILQTDEPVRTVELDNTAFALQSEYVSDITSVVCPFKDTIDYEVGRVKCGLITVPENREKPNSRQIRLLFAQIVASGRLPNDEGGKKKKEDGEDVEVREDPVVYLTGGPGVNIEPYVSRFLEHDLTKSRDLFILNQRGIGDSGEVCPYFSATGRENISAVTLSQSEAEAAERTKACFDAARQRGIDLTGYNTVENARDIRSLRRALGFDSWNVWGISYGSHLGQMLVNVDSEGIRALVLDAIVPNDLGDIMRIHRWVLRNHNLVFDECERQQAGICDGLKSRFYKAYDSIIKNPLTVDALDKELYPAGKVTVPGVIVGFAPFAMQYEQDEHPAIPAVMLALSQYAEQRDKEIFQVFTVAGGPFSGSSDGMSSAIRCNDGYMEAQARIAKEDLSEDFGLSQGIFTVKGARMMADMCIEAGLPPRDRKDYMLVQSNIPTLIVNGEWDPVTPPPLAERIAPGFTNGRLIIVPYAGHGPTRSMSECGSQVMSDFFDAPDQDLFALDATCLEEGIEPPEFLNYVQTDAALRLVTRYSDDPKRLIGPGVSFAALTFVVFAGFLSIVVGYISRRFSSLPDPYHAVGPVLPRLLGLITTVCSLLGLGLLGAGAAAAVDISEISIIAGLAPPARTGAALLFLSMLTGAATVYTTVASHKFHALRRRTVIGLPLVGISAIFLALYLMSWGVTFW